MASSPKALRKSSKKRPAYHRILLKLSGESMQGPQGFGIDGQTIYTIAKELREVNKLGRADRHHGRRREYFPRGPAKRF